MNDSQRYKLIIWHLFLKDLKKVEDKIEFFGYKVDYGAMAKTIATHVKWRKNHDVLYPWKFMVKNKNGSRRVCFECLLNEYYDSLLKEYPNRWFCDICQKYVMKKSRFAHLKSKKHNQYIYELQRKSNSRNNVCEKYSDRNNL